MQCLVKTMLIFVFLYNTTVLPSLPAQSATPSNLINHYCPGMPCCYKNQADQHSKSDRVFAVNKAENIFLDWLALLKKSRQGEYCKIVKNARVRGWFYSRFPVPAVFLQNYYFQKDAEIEPFFHYAEKDRHTFLARINMESFYRERQNTSR